MVDIDDPINGSTHPEILALALSGHLAAAAGGENEVNQDEAREAVQAVYERLTVTEDAPAVEDTPAPEQTAPAPATPALSTPKEQVSTK